MTDRRQHRVFLRSLLYLAIPLALQDLLLSSVNLVDTIMIGRIGQAEIAAVSICNQFYFIVLLYYFGIGSGAAVLMAQYWGSKNIDGIRHSLGLCLVGVLIGALVFSTAAIGFPQVIMRLFTPDPLVIAHGVGYLRLVGISYLFTGVTIAYTMAIRSAGDTRLPFYTSAFSLVLNVGLNWLLIFGMLGFPALGVRGAAIATSIARSMETMIILIIVYRRNVPAALGVAEVRTLTWVFLRRFMAVTAPVVAHELIWSIGFSTYKAIYARMGTAVLAANSIVEPAFRLAFVFLIGSANAGALMIGNLIGAKQRKLAQSYANRFLLYSPIVGIILGLLLALTARSATTLYNVAPEVHEMARRTLIMFLVLMPLKAVLLHIVVAILRGGGDNRYNMYVDLATTYGIGMPLVFLSGLVWGFPLPVVYLFSGVSDLVFLLLGLRRISTGRWIHDVIKP